MSADQTNPSNPSNPMVGPLTESLSARFRQAAQRHADRSPADESSDSAEAASGTLRLRDLLHLHGDDSAAVLLLVLSVLCVTPVAGIGTMVGFVMLAIAWRWGGVDRAHPLPDRLAAVSMNETWSRRCLNFLAWLYARADRHLQPRWAAVFHRGAHGLWGLWIALLALLIMLPLPLGNVLPGLSLVLLSLAWMFRDGVALLLSALPGLAGWALAFVFGDVVFKALQATVHKALGLI